MLKLTFKKQLIILGYKLVHEQLQIPSQETILKNVLKKYALAADRTHTHLLLFKMHCRGPAAAGSRGTLRMNGIGERET